jgi:hypothetical protein
MTGALCGRSEKVAKSRRNYLGWQLKAVFSQPREESGAAGANKASTVAGFP